jgi:hypothetical protein
MVHAKSGISARRRSRAEPAYFIASAGSMNFLAANTLSSGWAASMPDAKTKKS